MRSALLCALIAVVFASAAAIRPPRTGKVPPISCPDTAPTATAAPTTRHLTQTVANAADLMYGRPPWHYPPSGHLELGWPLKGWEWAMYAVSAVGSFVTAGAGMGEHKQNGRRNGARERGQQTRRATTLTSFPSHTLRRRHVFHARFHSAGQFQGLTR